VLLAQLGNGRRETPRRRSPGGLVVAVLALVVAGLFVCYLRRASTGPVNSDAASQALQAWDMLHGNVLLSGWSMSDVSFYTTELVEYAGIEAVRGLHPDVVEIASAVTYTLLVVLAAMLGRGSARGRRGLAGLLLAAGIVCAPAVGRDTAQLLGGPDHTGTAVPILVVLLFLDLAPERWWVAVATGLGLAWTQLADPLTLYAAIVPLAVVGLLRAARSRSWFDGWLVVAAVAAVAVADVAQALIRGAGGYTMNAIPGKLLAPVSEIPHYALVTGESVLMLLGADFWDPQTTLNRVLAVVHLVGVALVLAGFLTAVARFPGRLDRVSQLLAASVAVLIVAGVFGTHLPNITYAHEIAVIAPLGAALAGRMLAGPLAGAGSLADAGSARLGRVAAGGLAGVLAVCLAGLGYAATQPSVPAANAGLTGWLEQHGLTHGLSGYWQGSSVMVDSGLRVRLAVLRPDGTGVYRWETNSGWYDPRTSTATFVIAAPAPGSGIQGSRTAQPQFPAPPLANVERLFGKPARVYHVEGYLVLVYGHNLLRSL
jgi:hypothetical protein